MKDQSEKALVLSIKLKLTDAVTFSITAPDLSLGHS